MVFWSFLEISSAKMCSIMWTEKSAWNAQSSRSYRIFFNSDAIKCSALMVSSEKQQSPCNPDWTQTEWLVVHFSVFFYAFINVTSHFLTIKNRGSRVSVFLSVVQAKSGLALYIYIFIFSIRLRVDLYVFCEMSWCSGSLQSHEALWE